MEKQDLENKLNSLRLKWKGDYPKSDLEPNWWKFKCDKCLALSLIEQIKKIESGELTCEQMENILK